jgi:magnesium transporter
VLEDILSTGQRPKVDEFDDYIYFVLRLVNFVGAELVSEQVSFILGKNYVLSIAEKRSDFSAPIIDRIINKKGAVRSNKSDYLLYALIDVVVDNFYFSMDSIDARIEEIQTSIDNEDQNDRLLMLLRNLKKDVLQLRKHIVPTREAVYKLERLETALILENTDKYLRDLYDHTKQLEDTIETYNDTINNFREDYMSHLTLKTNKVIQILTIISSIFIPLTFIVGVYGMNFEFMPGLHWKYGFLSSILLMIFVSFIMVIVYVRNRWL